MNRRDAADQAMITIKPHDLPEDPEYDSITRELSVFGDHRDWVSIYLQIYEFCGYRYDGRPHSVRPFH